ncbi:MAG: HAMP domain-containing protein [Rhodoferax sp.]|jgi:two-component system OmpR family sensor kinase|nr:HAMP domain-containing protein [Rhodoferax sp.]
MSTPLHRRLYLRIWLAVVGTIAVLTLLAGWLARLDAEHERAQRPGREILVLDGSGQLVGQAPARPVRIPGQGLEFQVTTRDGQTLFIQLPRPAGRPPGMAPGMPPPTRFPLNLAWMLALVAVAVALGTYPIVRRLTKRLEAVQLGVRQWGDGNLALRLPEDGTDEVASLARGFNVAAQRVQELLQSHKSLLANASHELRSPLARIRMGLELMGSQPGPEFRNEIARNIQELDQLIDEILLASRLDASEADLGTVEEVDLLGMAAEECARVDADLDVPQEQHSLAVPGVSKLLRRVMRNLLENARRHAAGAIRLSLRTEAGTAVLRVCDQGPGVPPEFREKIFQPFFRLPGATERDGGVGLGLALVKSIVERHGGRVRCEDHPGGGACFVVTLPRSAPPSLNPVGRGAN